MSVENYRPVSHLVEIGKLVEYEVFDQVMKHFLSNDLFHANHHGGLPNHSTTTALIQIYDTFLNATQSKKITAALLLDQSAAYDLLDHSILLRKLSAYNFDENAINWFHSYLSGRSQSVQIETKQSPPIQLSDHSTPQGSVLGGLLFIIFENDFPACRVQGNSIMFVDDDTDIVSVKELDKLAESIQIESENSCQWLKDNRMVVAGQKSKLMVIGTGEFKRRQYANGGELSVLVDGKLVSETQSEKLLGVVLNNRLTWKEHLYGESWRVEGASSQGLINHLSQRVGMLKRISKVASKSVLRKIAQGLFYSKLSYCLPLFVNTWGLDLYKDGSSRYQSFTKNDLHKLQVLQNQVSRLLIQKFPGENYMSTVELLNRSGDLSVHQLGALSTLCLMKKILHTRKPSYIVENLQTIFDRGTRSGDTLRQSMARLEIVREGFFI